MANITATFNIVAQEDFVLKNSQTVTMPDGSTQEVVVPFASIFAPDKYNTYHNFVSLHNQFNAINSGSTYSRNQPMKFECLGLGDVLKSAWIMVAAPAIIPNTGASGVQAYYCQDAGFVMFPEWQLRVGNLTTYKATDRVNRENFELNHPNAMLKNNPYIGRYACEPLLERAARVNQTFHVPLCAPFFRQNEYNNAWFNYLFARQNVEWWLTGRSIKDFTVNGTAAGASGVTGLGVATDTAPYVYGTSTAITESNLQVNMWGLFYYLDEEERVSTASSAFQRLWQLIEHITYTSSEGVNTPIQKDVTLNHPTRAVSFVFQPNKNFDGTTKIPHGIGLKNYYVDIISGVDESFISIQWQQNGLKLIDEQNPISFLREERYVECYSRPSKQPRYLLANQPKLDTPEMIHTVNQSRVDKLTYTLKKNTALAGVIHLFQDYMNLVYANGGVGGVRFQ